MKSLWMKIILGLIGILAVFFIPIWYVDVIIEKQQIKEVHTDEHDNIENKSQILLNSTYNVNNDNIAKEKEYQKQIEL